MTSNKPWGGSVGKMRMPYQIRRGAKAPRVWAAATAAGSFVAAWLSCTATLGAELSPTVFRDGEFRFFFFSREESRVHIHVTHPDGEAKFWLKPTIELARNIGLSSSKIKDAERLIQSRQQEITDAWNNHFRS